MSDKNGGDEITGARQQSNDTERISKNIAEAPADVKATGTSTTLTASAPQDDESGESLELENERNTLYVSNLHPRIAEVHLQKLFGKYGAIVRIHFMRKPNLRNPRRHYTYAFVKYRSNESAQIAVEKVHDRTLLGQKMVVRYANSGRSDSDFGSAARRGTHTAKRQGSDVTPDERILKKQKNDVQKKIEAVKRALARKKEKP